jgi:rSAM/selenodomain-associated transferase 1
LRRTLIIMAKTPKRGLAKRRLGAEIGQARAIAFAQTSLQTTVRRLAADPRWQTLIAVSPASDVAASFWRRLAARHGVALIGQGEGDLGSRMRSLLRLAAGRGLVIGSDIPDVRPSHIARAFHLLGRADAVFGPAEDGGFWLVGLGPHLIHRNVFAAVRWSGPHALSDALANLPHARVAFAATLWDVDDASGYRRFRARAEYGSSSSRR